MHDTESSDLKTLDTDFRRYDDYERRLWKLKYWNTKNNKKDPRVEALVFKKPVLKNLAFHFYILLKIFTFIIGRHYF